MILWTGESSVVGLPVKAGETLIVDAVLLIMFFVVAGEAECFLKAGIVSG